MTTIQLSLLLSLPLLTLSAPVFNRNVVFTTRSSNSEIVLRCVPTACTNETNGCISLRRKQAQAPYWRFAVQHIEGSVFLPANDGKTVLEVPVYRGFSPFAYDFRSQRPETINRCFMYVKRYREGATDSVQLPAVVLVPANARFILTRGVMDPGKVIRLKGDSVAILTRQGVYRVNLNDLSATRAGSGVDNPASDYHPLRLTSRNECAYDLPRTEQGCQPAE